MPEADPHPASPSEQENLPPANVTGELQLGPSTSSGQAHPTSSGQPLSTSSAEPISTSLIGSPKQPEEAVSRRDIPWFHAEPDITRAVISKTEEELLSSLSALMRNRVENEKLQRQMTASMQAIDDAHKEHAAIKNQIRSAADELAVRTKE
ncbi:MAG: hypothetical protein WAM44_13190, partial [Chthoniobacterales bacterium]